MANVAEFLVHGLDLTTFHIYFSTVLQSDTFVGDLLSEISSHICWYIGCPFVDLDRCFNVRNIDSQIIAKAKQRCRRKLEKRVSYLKVIKWTPEEEVNFKHGFRDFRETDHVS